MKRHQTVLVIAALIFLCFVWGSTWLAIKINIREMPPLGAAAVRFLLAAALILATAGRRRLPSHEQLPFSFWMILAITMIGIPYSCVYWGQQYLPSGLTAVLFATYPLFVALLAHVSVAGERITPSLIAGVVSGFVGVGVLFSVDATDFHPRFLTGGLLILLCAVSAAVSTILVKRRLAHLDPLLINLRPMFLGGLLLLAIALPLERDAPWSFSPAGVGALLYLAIFGSVLAFGTYYWLMRVIPVSRLSFVTYVTPLVALGLGTWLGDEPLTPRIGLGTALVIGGIFMARRPSARGRLTA